MSCSLYHWATDLIATCAVIASWAMHRESHPHPCKYQQGSFAIPLGTTPKHVPFEVENLDFQSMEQYTQPVVHNYSGHVLPYTAASAQQCSCYVRGHPTQPTGGRAATG